jgi:serine/threonine protein kinase
MHFINFFCHSMQAEVRDTKAISSPTKAAITGWLNQILAAVSYCHSKGVAHCSLKPENLMLQEEGRLLVANFGLASCFEGGMRAPSVEGGMGWVSGLVCVCVCVCVCVKLT